MKVNLTKLLDSPTRVVRIGKPPGTDSTGYYSPRLASYTSPTSPYSFEIESDWETNERREGNEN